MDTDLLKRVKKILKKFKKYWENDKLRRTMVINDLRKYDSTLISELLSDEKIKNLYTTQINGFSVFKIDEIIDILRYKKYFADSYTKYSNEIGLSSEGKYLKYDSDVVLDFPYKDCILEGGMAKEDVGRDEIYYNEIIAKDEIDTLLEPKVFTNVKKYDSEGIHKVMEIEDGDNLIIKGNNLLALYSIKERYKGKIKVIYIDPPYNTGNDSFKYNDRFNHSTWLTFMKNRLEISHKLLNKDGLMWINLDDNEAHYCKVLIDEIFSIDNFIADVIWQSRKSVSNDALISSNTNHILCYAKRKENIDKKIFKLPLDKSKFKYYDEKSDDYYRTEPFDAPNIRNNLTYKILNPNTKEVYLPPQGRCWRTTKEEYEKLLVNNRIQFGQSGSSKPQLKVFLKQSINNKLGKTTTNLWNDLTTTTNATKELNKLFLHKVFNNPKPEELIQRIINLSTNSKNDIVLDFNMGSATTQAVAMKMDRKFIGVEQMDYINTVSIPRLQKVMEGEQSGISKEVNWKGGGSFIYVELMKLNQYFIDKILDSNSSQKLISILTQMSKKAYLDFRVNIENLIYRHGDMKQYDDKVYFTDLSLKEQKELLINILDKNQLYVNYSDIDDEDFRVSNDDKKFNYNFYNEE